MYSPMLVTLGVEDILSESVARRLVSEYAPEAQVIHVIGLRGNQALKQRIRDFAQIARYVGPSLVITDLDSFENCPADLVREWTNGLQVVPNFLMRVAVIEIEAWVTADRQAIAEWLGISVDIVPRNLEEVPNPKQEIVELARRSQKRGLRDALIRSSPDGLFRPGPGYNDYLGSFVDQHWEPERARLSSSSLDRAIMRITEMTSRNIHSSI